jgi:hypothetical protein
MSAASAWVGWALTPYRKAPTNFPTVACSIDFINNIEDDKTAFKGIKNP